MTFRKSRSCGKRKGVCYVSRFILDLPTSYGNKRRWKTVYDLVDEYKLFLEGHHPERANSFDILCRNQPESARTEAVVFAFLMWNDYDIAVEETPDGGGVDFRVRNGNTEFVVEATSILRDTFTNRSNVPEDPWASGRGVHVDPYDVCHKVRQKVAAKAEQMSGYGCPTILVIACEHGEYQTCLKKDEDVGIGADSFLTSPRVLGLPDLVECNIL